MPGNRNTHHHRSGRSIPSRPFDPPKLAKPSRGTSRIAPDLREAVFTRAGGLCELCGQHLAGGAWQAHHRKLRSRGGQDSVSNLVALHPLCHNRLHGHPAWALEVGFIVEATADPARVRLALHGETWVRLRIDGTYQACT